MKVVKAVFSFSMKRFLVLLLNSLVLCVLIIVAENITDATENTLDFVNKARNKLEISKNPNIILVIGLTGVGKSTLIHCVATDCSQLLSIDTGEIDYTVRDELDAKTGNITFTSESRTLTPEITIDEAQNIWYDCPGFGNTQNETVEIATTYLIKRVIESASSAKIVLVVDYDSITTAHNRNGFEKLLSNSIQLLKNTVKFKSSVSLVISKAPSVMIRKRKYVEISEGSVIDSGVRFMRGHRLVLQKKRSNQQKIDLIDALLEQSSNGDYPKISVFWRPNDEGPFNTIEKMMTGQRRIRDSIIEHTSYVDIQMSDFGFPLSAETQIKITNMSAETIKSISNNLQNITTELTNELQKQIDMALKFQRKLELIGIGKRNINSDVRDLKQLNGQLKGFVHAFNVSSIDLNDFDRIEKHESDLNMLQSLIEAESLTKDMNLNGYTKEIVDRLDDLEVKVQRDIADNVRWKIANISNILVQIDNDLLREIQQKVALIYDFNSKFELLELDNVHISRNVDETSLKPKIQEIIGLIRVYNISNTYEMDILRIEMYEKQLNELKVISMGDFKLPIRDWIAVSSKTSDFVTAEYNWYSLLNQMYEHLAGYEIQRNAAAYNVAELSNWGQINKPQGLIIDVNNFDAFIKLFTSLSDFLPTPNKLKELNEIVRITLKSPTSFECHDQILTIKGIFIKSSDISIHLKKCSQNIQKINVYAVDRFYVDGDLNLVENTDVELHIFTNTFIVLQIATFVLNGKKGEAPQSPPDAYAMPGKPGNPGANSGNFFALANKIVNGELLTVQQIGGAGGNGQDGTGKPDFSVTFNHEKYSYTSAGKWKAEDIKDHVMELVTEKSEGNQNVLETYSSCYIDHYALVDGAVKCDIEFNLPSSQCCGPTGSGGQGKSTVKRTKLFSETKFCCL